MPVIFSALMCHAPIVVPAVGGARAWDCRGTTRAMREIADRTVRSRPDRLVLISPHSPRHEDRWSAWRGRHVGDLADFRAPEVRVDLPDAPEVAEALELAETRGHTLDHGAMVPLAFLWEAGWRGPTAILAQPWSEQGAADIGRAIAQLPGRTAVIASGDMSHALKPGAPSGFHPDAQAFDDAFVDALRRHAWSDAMAPPHREIAREDVVTSATVAMVAAGQPLNAEVLSYEGPWGVGYTEAVFSDPDPPLYAVARAAVQAAADEVPYEPPSGGPAAAGVFVTLKRDGELRGCIGHVRPVCRSLYAEIAEVARASATQDPRCPVITPEELDDLEVEVSVLEPAEPITDLSQLDPAVYGVIVESRGRRGLLLPGIEQITTVEDQVSIARRKAGILQGEPIRMKRFRTTTQHRP